MREALTAFAHVTSIVWGLAASVMVLVVLYRLTANFMSRQRRHPR